MSKPISITDECHKLLEDSCFKDERENRIETYSEQIIRIINEKKATV